MGYSTLTLLRSGLLVLGFLQVQSARLPAQYIAEVWSRDPVPILQQAEEPPGDSKTSVSYSGCTSGQFRCDDGTCIPASYKCDNFKDCWDNSDEKDCQVCKSNQFKCGDNKCIPINYKCDKIVDCKDSSDEANCAGGCKTNEFRCGSGLCIPDKYRCDSIQDCDDDSDEMNCEVDSKGTAASSDSVLSCENCGVKYPPDSRIFHGSVTGINEWPWQVYLQIMRATGGFMCGGVIYKSKYIITAAHCLWKGTKSVRVFVGDHALYGNIEFEAEKIPAKKIIVHPGYRKNPLHKFDHDIAIVVLTRPILFSERVRPICLPTKDSDFSGQILWVTGWGVTETGTTSNVLKETSITLWSQEVCQNIGTTDNMICGLGNQNGQPTDTCKGDSGGPLVYKGSDGKWMLAGLVSHGPNPCAVTGYPGVYTKITNYLDWIQQNTSDGQC